MNQESSYYAIIPACVRYDKSLPAAAKLLFGEIFALAQKEGYCFAGNGYFAELYEVSKDTVSDWIGKLSKSGYIWVEMDRLAGNARRIYLSDKIEIGIGKNTDRGIGENTDRGGIGENADTYRQKGGYLSRKMPIPIGENTDTYRQKDRFINTTINTTTNTSLADAVAPVGEDEKETSRVGSGQQKPVTLTHQIRLLVERLYPDYAWSAKDGKHAKELGKKLAVSFRGTKSRDPSDADLIKSLTTLLTRCKSLPPYYQFKDIPKLNERYNETIVQIKKPTTDSVSEAPPKSAPSGRQIG